jgi:hypothetical protein
MDTDTKVRKGANVIMGSVDNLNRELNSSLDHLFGDTQVEFSLIFMDPKLFSKSNSLDRDGYRKLVEGMIWNYLNYAQDVEIPEEHRHVITSGFDWEKSEPPNGAYYDHGRDLVVTQLLPDETVETIRKEIISEIGRDNISESIAEMVEHYNTLSSTDTSREDIMEIMAHEGTHKYVLRNTHIGRTKLEELENESLEDRLERISPGEESTRLDQLSQVIDNAGIEVILEAPAYAVSVLVSDRDPSFFFEGIQENSHLYDRPEEIIWFAETIIESARKKEKPYLYIRKLNQAALERTAEKGQIDSKGDSIDPTVWLYYELMSSQQRDAVKKIAEAGNEKSSAVQKEILRESLRRSLGKRPSESFSGSIEESVRHLSEEDILPSGQRGKEVLTEALQHL